MEQESIEFDVVIVGAGPAGLATAIQLKTQARQANCDLDVCVLEKGADVGAHILSGAVLEPRALDELLPNWRDNDELTSTPVTKDQFCLLSKNRHWQLPTPPAMHNTGNYIISLGKLCRWLANQAEDLGVEIYASTSVADFAYDAKQKICGIVTSDMGVAKDGTHTSQYQPGMKILAKQCVLAEGCRGSLTKAVMSKYQLNKDCDPQTYAIGIKELWEIDPKVHQAGTVLHTIGWPLDNATYGGSFVYHKDKDQLALGFVIGLDYQNPYLSPYDELQRFKTHPLISKLLAGGRRISYGARALNEGGWQSIPKLSFPGGLIVGCGAGFMNVPKIKGTHTAMKSGMLAANTIIQALLDKRLNQELTEFQDAINQSWIASELCAVRNIRPAFRWGLWPGLAYSALDTYVLRNKAPWTLRHHQDHLQLKPAKDCVQIDYPKADGVLTFDKLESVSFSNVAHGENQPNHLQLTDPKLAIAENWTKYASPEQRYCPAGVYEIIKAEDGSTQLQINAQNCIHCKTCDIKDPLQNINWTAPQGGDGPNYPQM